MLVFVILSIGIFLGFQSYPFIHYLVVHVLKIENLCLFVLSILENLATHQNQDLCFTRTEKQRIAAPKSSSKSLNSRWKRRSVLYPPSGKGESSHMLSTPTISTPLNFQLPSSESIVPISASIHTSEVAPPSEAELKVHRNLNFLNLNLHPIQKNPSPNVLHYMLIKIISFLFRTFKQMLGS